MVTFSSAHAQCISQSLALAIVFRNLVIDHHSVANLSLRSSRFLNNRPSLCPSVSAWLCLNPGLTLKYLRNAMGYIYIYIHGHNLSQGCHELFMAYTWD